MPINTEYNNIREKNIDVNKRLEDNVKVHKVKQIGITFLKSLGATFLAISGSALFVLSASSIGSGIAIGMNTPQLLAAVIIVVIGALSLLLSVYLLHSAYEIYNEAKESAKNASRFDQVVEARRQETNNL